MRGFREGGPEERPGPERENAEWSKRNSAACRTPQIVSDQQSLRSKALNTARLSWDEKMVHPKRFELLTPRFVVWCSIQLSYGCIQACSVRFITDPLGTCLRPASKLGVRNSNAGEMQAGKWEKYPNCPYPVQIAGTGCGCRIASLRSAPVPCL